MRGHTGGRPDRTRPDRSAGRSGRPSGSAFRGDVARAWPLKRRGSRRRDHGSARTLLRRVDRGGPRVRCYGRRPWHRRKPIRKVCGAGPKRGMAAGAVAMDNGAGHRRRDSRNPFPWSSSTPATRSRRPPEMASSCAAQLGSPATGTPPRRSCMDCSNASNGMRSPGPSLRMGFSIGTGSRCPRRWVRGSNAF